jgi:hypothetical protein
MTITALNEISQREIMPELDSPPTKSELDEQILRARNDSAPGESGVTNEALKHLSEKGKEMLLRILQNAFTGATNPPEWRRAILKCLFKNKGDPSNPDQWRGICLKDMTARLLSAIINSRLLKIIAKHGTEIQYGSQPERGCQDGIFVLRAALETRRYHDLPTWALFVDLVKAFDTVNHALLFAILEKYGAPRTSSQQCKEFTPAST